MRKWTNCGASPIQPHALLDSETIVAERGQQARRNANTPTTNVSAPGLSLRCILVNLFNIFS